MTVGTRGTYALLLDATTVIVCVLVCACEKVYRPPLSAASHSTVQREHTNTRLVDNGRNCYLAVRVSMHLSIDYQYRVYSDLCLIL